MTRSPSPPSTRPRPGRVCRCRRPPIRALKALAGPVHVAEMSSSDAFCASPSWHGRRYGSRGFMATGGAPSQSCVSDPSDQGVRGPIGGSEQFADELRGPLGTFAIDRQEVVADADLFSDRRGDLRWGWRSRSHASPGAVPLEPVVDVAVLFEVVLEWEVEKRSCGSRRAPCSWLSPPWTTARSQAARCRDKARRCTAWSSTPDGAGSDSGSMRAGDHDHPQP